MYDMRNLVVFIIYCCIIQTSESQSRAYLDSQKLFLSNLYDLLSDYEFQKNPKSYNVGDLRHWNIGNDISAQGIKIKKENYQDFLNILSRYNIDVSEVRNLQDNAGIIAEINEILTITLKKMPRIVCRTSDNSLDITSTFFKTSNLFKIINQYCDENEKLESINIYVYNTIFIDSDLDLSRFKAVAIFAKKWWVLNSFHIIPSKFFMGLTESDIENSELLRIPLKHEDINFIVLKPSTKQLFAERFGNYIFHFHFATINFKRSLLSDLGNDIDIDIDRKLEFFTNLITNSQVRDTYNNPVEIYNDFIILEQEFYRIDDKSILFNIYRQFSIISRRLLLKKTTYKSDSDEIKLLIVISTAIMSKLSSMEDTGSTFITNIRGFSDFILRKFEDLQRVGDKIIIERNRDEFKGKLDQKSVEIDELINQHIAPKLEEILKRLDQEISKLSEEIKRMEQNAEDNLERLEIHRQNLVILTSFRSFFNFIGIILGVVPGLSVIGKFAVDFGADALGGAIEREKYENSFKLLPLEGAEYLKAMQKYEDKASAAKNQIKSCEITKKNSRNVRSVFGDLASDLNSISEVDKKIEETKEYIENLQNSESYLCSTIKPAIDILIDQINGLKLTLKDKSRGRLIVENWQIQRQLKSIKNQITHIFKNFVSEQMISHTISEIIDVLNTVISSFNLIQKYSEQKDLVYYMAQLQTDRFSNIPVQNRGTQAMIDKLLFYTRSNIILSEYKLFIEGLKRFAFPLAEKYFAEFQIAEEFTIKNNTEDAIRLVLTQINGYRDKLSRSDVAIGRFDDIRHKSTFYGVDGDTDGPFYIWKNHYNHRIFKRLLDGKEVLLTSRQVNDKVSSNFKMNAVKFNAISLRFKVLKNNHKLNQNHLDYILENSQLLVSLTHMGNSYYKCDNKTFIITTESQNIRYSLHKMNGKSVIQNDLYEKIMEGDSILSPYTTWKIQLVNLKQFNFSVLQQYAKFVDLELVGEGEYYSSDDKSLCGQNLEKYYELENIDNSEIAIHPGFTLYEIEPSEAMISINSAELLSKINLFTLLLSVIYKFFM